MATYKEKLLDPRWQKKRLEILDRDLFMCQECGETEKTLHVHHLQYHGEPWDAPEKELVTLCCDCHSEYPERQRQCAQRLAKALLQKGCLPGKFEELAEILEASNVNLDYPPALQIAALGFSDRKVYEALEIVNFSKAPSVTINIPDYKKPNDLVDDDLPW